MIETLLFHLLMTVFMTGLCWFVQLVHYPLFLEIDLKQFPAYERKNIITSFITVPVMTLEMISGLVLLYLDFNYLMMLNMLLFGVIGWSTFRFQVPMHLQLMNEANTDLIHKLIKSNWIRTISWTIRSIILVFVAYQLTL